MLDGNVVVQIPHLNLEMGPWLKATTIQAIEHFQAIQAILHSL